MKPAALPPADGVLAPSHERLVLWLLALTQFTVIMDFMVMMPLGPQLMQAFAIGPAAFAGAVSAYAWCAGLSGFLAATYIDRFDRRRLLLVVYALFALSNLGCALATSVHGLLAARAFAGLTGGVLGSLVMAIVADLIPAGRRGAATGTVMTSFSLAAIAGVPLGVVLGAHYGWASPFYLLVVLSLVIWCAAMRIVPALRAQGEVLPFSQSLPRLVSVLTAPAHRRAYALTALMMCGHMMVIAFISPTLVANLGIAPQQLSWIYMAGGAATLFSSRAIGRLADRFGKARVFRIVALFSIVPILVITHLPAWPLLGLVLFFPFFMVAMSGRNIPMQALLTTVPEPAQRGAFVSINSAVQQLASGSGAWFGGLLLTSGPAGHLLGYGLNGWIAAALTLAGVWWVGHLSTAGEPPRPAMEPAAAGG